MARHGSTFGRREHTGQDAAQDDEHGHETPDRLIGDPTRLFQRDRFAFRELAAMRNDHTQDHEGSPQQNAGNDACHEKMRDRDRTARGQGVDHHVVRGRNQERL